MYTLEQEHSREAHFIVDLYSVFRPLTGIYKILCGQ